MGLPGFQLSADLATQWRTILVKSGLNVRPDESEAEKCKDERGERWVAEVPWIVTDGSGDLRVLEATFRDRVDGKWCLIIMPPRTPAERQLLVRVEEVLVTSGAIRVH
jgi:hypothetical protein